MARVGDLPGTAGAGFPGVSLFEYHNCPYITFWVENSEAYPPGTKAMYDASLWEIRDPILNPSGQLGITCLNVASGIDKVFCAHSLFFDEQTSIQEYSSFVNLIFENPSEVLLGGELYGEQAGIPLAKLKQSLSQNTCS